MEIRGMNLYEKVEEYLHLLEIERYIVDESYFIENSDELVIEFLMPHFNDLAEQMAWKHFLFEEANEYGFLAGIFSNGKIQLVFNDEKSFN